MPMIREAIDKMSPADRMMTMEYLWSVMSNSVEPDEPEWHAALLNERRRRAVAGEEAFISVSESKRRLRESVYAR